MKDKFGQTSRSVALGVLQDVFVTKAYANIALSKRLNESRLSPLDRRLTTELVYGTIKACGTLDWILGHYIKKALSQTDPMVLNILRLGVYQLYFLDKIPSSAAVNESVNLAKKFAHQSSTGFINAVLRSVLREPEKVRYPNLVKDPVRHIALREFHPEWLVRRWLDKLGVEETQALCRFNNETPPLTLRTQTLRISREELMEKMTNSGSEVEPSLLAPEGILCRRMGDEPLRYLREGLCQAQDESSMLPARVLAPEPGELVLDACSAPGGKATHMAQLMQNKGAVIARDIHEHKLKLIDDAAARLGITIVKSELHDAALRDIQHEKTFDKVLLDAPCTGLGIIRRKPDIKWARETKDIESITALQKQLINIVSHTVKPGGILVYSTCTVLPEENEEMVNTFLKQNNEFEADAIIPYLPVELAAHANGCMLQLFPNRDGIDGFFIARIRRKG